MAKPDLGQNLGVGSEEIVITEGVVNALVDELRQLWQEHPENRDIAVGTYAFGAGLAFGDDTRAGRAAKLMPRAMEKLLVSDDKTDQLIGLNIGMWLNQGQQAVGKK